MKNVPMLETNVYSDAFTEFQESKLYNSILNEFTPQPYYKQFRALFYTALIAAIIFQVFSGLTASTLVYFFTNGMIGSPILAASITVAFLVLLWHSGRNISSLKFFSEISVMKNYDEKK